MYIGITEQTEIVAIVLEDVARTISATCADVRASIDELGIGWGKKLAKDFLPSNATTLRISRGVNAHKRKCCGIKLNVLPQALQVELKHGKFNSSRVILHLRGAIFSYQTGNHPI